MRESFLERARENLKAAELLFEKGLYNASANRAYYAAFHISIAAIFSIGITPSIEHKVVQTLFTDNYFNRRKVLPSKFKRYLYDMQNIRSDADYKNGVSKKTANQQLKESKEFIEIILEVI